MGHHVFDWNASEVKDPGPLLDICVTNSPEILLAWREAGLECPPPVRFKALLDTGASTTIVSKKMANHCKLFQTGRAEVRALGASHICGEHAGSISFPGTVLKSFDNIRIVSGDFIREPYFACLIGRDILRHWSVSFDGPGNRVSIED